MQGRIIRHRVDGPQPDMLAWRAALRVERIDRFNRPHLDGPFTGQNRPLLLRQLLRHLPAQLFSRNEPFRRRYVGHDGLMIKPFFIDLKRNRHIQNRPAVLNGDHPPGREAVPVPDALHIVDDRGMGIARPQEISMQRMGATPLDGLIGRHKGLAENLAAKDALAADVPAVASKQVIFQPFQAEMCDQILNEMIHGSSL